MHVRMLGEVLPPRMQHHRDGRLASEVLGVTGEGQEGGRGRLEEKTVELTWVEADQRIEGVRQGEDDVEVFHRQQRRGPGRSSAGARLH